MDINTEQYQQLLQWFEFGSGSRYLEQEKLLYEKCLKSSRGNNLLISSATRFQELAGLKQFKSQSQFELSDFSKKLSYPDASFDCIIFPHILEFLSEPKLILLEAQRLLNPEGGGTLLISGFCSHYYLYWRYLFGKNLDKKIAKIKILSASNLKALAHFASLDPCKISYFSNTRFPLLREGYLLELRRSEYAMEPFSPGLLKKNILIGSAPAPSLANLAK